MTPPGAAGPLPLDALGLLKLLQFASPALPVGAFAYSQGLEQATSLGWVHDETTAEDWIRGVVSHVLCRLDVPVLRELHAAFSVRDRSRARELSRFLHACRESAEIAAEDRQLGGAFARVLEALGAGEAHEWIGDEEATFATLFALASVHFELPLRASALAYAFCWCENQVAAASRLVPLGHLSAQRVLSRLAASLPDAVCSGLALDLDEAGFAAPGLGILSALHETAYTRLFRS